ncbi:unnamed protein product [Dicrocoelium dendriticum]|nr:unnamed protein product [Dicrocoelium dendriticum]
MFRVSEFPTIRFIDGAVSVKYAGDRSARDIVTFALRAHGPAVKTVNTESDFERNATFFSSDPFFVFIGDSDSELKTTYHQIAEQFRLLSWFLSAPRIALPERFSSFVGLIDPLESSLVVFKEDSAIPYPGWSAVPEDDRRQHLTEWILRERFPMFQRFELPGIWEFGSSELSASANRGSTTDSNDLPPYRLIALFLVRASSENAMTTKLLQMGKSLAKRRVPYLTKHFHFGWADTTSELADFAMVDLPVPGLVVVDPVTRDFYLHSTQPLNTLEEDVFISFLHSVSKGTIPSYGGNTLAARLHRLGRRLLLDITTFFYNYPLISLLILGVTITLVSCIAYVCCCLDELYEDADHPMVESDQPSKSSGSSSLSNATAEGDDEVVVVRRGTHSTPRFLRSPPKFTNMGPVISKEAVDAKRMEFEEWKKTR